MRQDIVPGALFPDYELSDHTGKHRKLFELQGQDPMVLVLSRGGYCPKDRRQAEGLVELYRELEVGYCRLVTISTDNILETNEYRTGVGAHWPFLSDTRRIVQKDLDIAEYTDAIHNPMIPHVIVLEPGLLIYKIYNGYWFFGRPTVEDLRQDLRVVLKKCGRTGTSRRPSSRRRGNKAARTSSIRTARPTPKLSVSRIRSSVRVSKAVRRWPQPRSPVWPIQRRFDRLDPGRTRAQAALEWRQGQARQHQQAGRSLPAEPVHDRRARRYPRCQDYGTEHRPWLTALPDPAADEGVIALANRIARKAWAMMATGRARS